MALALFLPLMVSGCGTSGSGTVRPLLPALPGNLAVRCPDPGVRDGADARGELARNRQALATCTRKHADTVVFYDDVRTRLGGRP